MTEALFIVCVVLICVVALALAVWLIVTLVKGNRKDDAGRVVVVDDTAYVLVRVGDKAAVAQAAAEPAPAEPAPVAQELEEEAAPVEPSVQESEEEPCDEESEEEQEPQDVEGMITLRRNETLPYPEAYEALSSIEKSCVDDILAYAESKEGAKKVVNDKSASVYYGKKLLVRILLRRDKITARLTVQNNEFIAYTDKEGLNIKAKPVDVRVDTPETIEHIKNIINITYNDFYEERARREEEKREARREARRLKREAEKRAAEEAAAAQSSADQQAEAE
ncbi:MAG TPA: hypothetical protein H9670_03700 [Firmicutes bacterium]|nr:hypothetical protein [Bacillota bacterium]